MYGHCVVVGRGFGDGRVGGLGETGGAWGGSVGRGSFWGGCCIGWLMCLKGDVCWG